jgi:hypothetical protein
MPSTIEYNPLESSQMSVFLSDETENKSEKKNMADDRGVDVQISEEGKEKSLSLQSQKNKINYTGLHGNRLSGDYVDDLVLLATLDPVAYKEFMELAQEDGAKDEEDITVKYGSYRSTNEMYFLEKANRKHLDYFNEWFGRNKERIEAFYLKLRGGRAPMASEFELQYDAELHLKNNGVLGDMFRNSRALPTRTVMELSVEQYRRIHEQGDEKLIEALTDALKKAGEIGGRLDDAAGQEEESRLRDARIGFTLADDGSATFYVKARDEDALTWTHDIHHIYASKDIDELVQNVINKENGMAHFQYID